MNNIELKKQKYDTIFKAALIGVAALIISPIIFAVAGAAIAGLIGLIAVNAAPVISMKLANWKVKGIINEAKENPIETLTNLLIEKKQAFKAFQQKVTEAATARNSFSRKCEDFAVKYPARAPEFQQQLKNMTRNVEKMKTDLANVEKSIENGELKLEEMIAYWDMSQALIAANLAAGMDIGDIYAKLKADTAVDSVLDNMGRAFAEMEVTASLQLENEPSQPLGTILDVKSKTVV